MIPFIYPAQKIDQVDSKNKDKEKFIKCLKSRFPIRIIIVFAELDLIIFVSQGLTLSTATLVWFINRGITQFLSIGLNSEEWTDQKWWIRWINILNQICIMFFMCLCMQY